MIRCNLASATVSGTRIRRQINGLILDSSIFSCSSCPDEREVVFRAVISRDRLQNGEHLDIPWKQVFDSVDGMVGDAVQHSPQICLGIDAIQLGRLDQAVEGCRALTAGIGTCEQVILASECDATQRSLCRRVIDLDGTVVTVARQCVPTGQMKRPRSRRLASRHNPSPVHHSTFTRSPLRPRNTKMCPLNGFSANVVCTLAARPLKPQRMSVTPAAIQMRVPAGRPTTEVRSRCDHRRNAASTARDVAGSAPWPIRTITSAKCTSIVPADKASSAQAPPPTYRDVLQPVALPTPRRQP